MATFDFYQALVKVLSDESLFFRSAKRYERFLKQHQLHQSQNPGNNANAPKAPNNTKAKNAKGNGSLVAPSAGLGKKRKMTAASDGDDELELKPAKKIAKSNNNNQEDGSDANTGNKLISKTEVDAEKVKKEIMDGM